MNIHYKITFHTYWHCGSGLASGADADLLVIKDKDGLPYVPGKTIKGLIKEAVDLLYPGYKDTNDYKFVFGISGDEKRRVRVAIPFSKTQPYRIMSESLSSSKKTLGIYIRPYQVLPLQMKALQTTIPSERFRSASLVNWKVKSLMSLKELPR